MVWAVFSQTVNFDFVNYDDPTYVYKNPAITRGLNWPGVVWLFTHINAGTWFPLTDLTHQLDWQLYGANAGGHHLTNVLLHAATAILLFLLLRDLTGRFWPAAFVAAVFAIHPLRAESVAWVVERKDVLSGLFFMLALWAWTSHVRIRAAAAGPGNFAGDPRGWTVEYFLALAFFALGLLSKSMVVTLPFVLLLLDYWPLNRLASAGNGGVRTRLRSWLGLILEKLPFLLLSAAICVTTVLTQKNAVLIAHSVTIPVRIGNALLAYVVYLRHLVYPVGLAVSYVQPGMYHLVSAGGAALLLLAITAITVAGRRRHPYLLVGWLWYLGMLLPVIDIMQTGHNARADRYTYLPQIGLYILMTWGAVELSASWRQRRKVLGLGAAAILTGLLAGDYVQTSYWKNSVTLWNRVLACESENAFAYNNLGSAMVAQGKWREAETNFERALKIDPDYPEAEVNLGVALTAMGQREEALEHFQEALRLNPYSAAAEYNLGDAMANQGKPTEAIPHFERALQFRPGYPEADYDLGLALAEQEKWDEAIPHFERGLHFKLTRTDAEYITAVALRTDKKWAEAIGLYDRVLQARPDDAQARNDLGIALANLGKSAEARAQFHQALALATAQGNNTLAKTIRTRLNSDSLVSPQPETP